ncbi:MAG: TonB-dependent receptor, partial [Geobacter sp.]
YDDYNNGKYARDIGETDSYAPFLQVEKKFLSGRANVTAGIRYDTVMFHDGFSENTNNVSLSAGELRERTWRSFTPKLSAGYKYSERAAQYISYGRGFRTGELEDMVLTLIKGTWYQKPNPDLGPEKADTAETGFRLNPAAGLYLDPSLYLTAAKDFIYQVETGVIAAGKKERIYTNVGKVRIYGAELPVKYIAGDFSFSAAYAQSHSRITSAPGLAIEGCQLTFAPRHIYSAGLAWKRGDAKYFASWTHKSRQFTNDANTESGAGYSVMNIGAERKFPGEFFASLRFGNLFNERYQQASDELSPGRIVTGTLKVAF